MKILKRMTAALLALVMVVAMLPVSALAEEIVGDGVLDVPEAAEAEAVETTAPEVFVEEMAEVVAADDAPASGSCGENLTWTLVDGVLTISGTGEMTHYGNEDFTPWAQYGEEIRTIVIGSGVSNIPVLAFKYDHVADILADAESPFYSSADGVLFSKDKTILYSVPKGRTGTYTVPDGVLQIGDWAFSKCVNLASVEISEGVQTIGYSAFYSCTALRSVLLPESLIHIDGSAFTGTGIESLTIPKNVTTIANSFATSCFDLTAIQVAEGNKNYASIDGVLFSRDMTRLIQYPAGKKTDSYEIPKGVETICGDAMSFLEIKEVVIPQSVTEIGFAAFWRCAASDIFFQGDAPEIDDSAFNLVWANCHYPKNNDTWTADVRKEQYGPYGHLTWTAYDPQAEETETISGTCGENLTWTLVDGVLTISGMGEMNSFTSDDPPWAEQGGTITEAHIEKGVSTIGDWAFACCPNLTSITIPDGIITIGDGAFDSCALLAGITIPDSVKNIGYEAFQHCSSLTSVTIPDGVISIGDSAFSNCNGLVSVTIPDSVTTIYAWAFAYCGKLVSITLSDSITSIAGGTFYSCSSLESITLPDGITSIGNSAFTGCIKLEKIVIPDGVTELGYEAFYGCDSLKSIIVPEGVVKIGNDAFGDCDNLLSAVIPEGVSKIGNDTFWGCERLERIAIPASVTEIGDSAFKWCEFLADVYYGGSEEQWADITIGSNNGYLKNAAIHFNSTMPGTGSVPAPSDGPVSEYVDNSSIRINGAGIAWAHYIGEPNQEYTVRVDGNEVPCTANEEGLFGVLLGTFDSVGERTVTVEITHVGGQALPTPQVFQSKVTVTPLEFSQSWEVSLDPSVAVEFNLGGELSLVQLEGSLAKAEGKIGVGAAMNISRSYSAEGETLEFSSDKKIEKGQTYKCGITGAALKSKFEGPVFHVGFSGGETIRYGLKIEDYSPQNSQQQRAIATYLLGEILAANPSNVLYVPFYRNLAEKYYQKGGFQVVNGSASKLTGTVGGKAGEIEINGVDIASVLEAEVKASLQEAEETVSNGDKEKSLALTLETDIAALALKGEELLLDTSVLGIDFLGRDMELAAKVSGGKKSLETTSLSSRSTEMKILMLGVPSTATYNKYSFQDDALDGLFSRTSHFDDYINTDLCVLSFLDLIELAKAISDSDAHIPYESETKEKYAVTLPLEFGLSAIVGGKLGVELSFLADTSYTTAAGYAADDKIVLQSESGDLSDLVEANKRYPAEIFTNCIQSLADDAASFFKKAVGKIQEGVDAGWSWVKEKGESAREWLIEITSAPSKNDGAWGESMKIDILGSYVNFSLARQVSTPSEAYVTRSAMTIGRPFVVNVTDNATGEAIENFEGEPLEFTIRYAGEDLMAANYDAETQVISMYRYSDDGDYFEYIGGAHDADAKTVTATITKPGQYILAAEVIEEEDHDYQLGDVNHDGKINAKDATLILQKSVGVLKETAAFCEACAEVSGDGKLNAKDSTLILQFSVGLRQDFPGQK